MKKTLFIFFWFTTLVSTVNAQQNDYLVAENYYRSNQFEKAIQLYQKLYKKSKFNTTYLERLISCYQETNQFEKVEEIVKSSLAKRPDLTYYHVIRGYNYERQQMQKEADTSYKEALNQLEKKQSFGSLTANLFKNYNKLDLAIQTYDLLIAKNPKANFGFQLAQIYGEKGDFNKMFASYVDLVDKNENYLKTVKRYASRYITDDAENESNIALKKALLRKSVSKPKNIWNSLLAWLFTTQKDYYKALTQHKALFARDPNNISGVIEIAEIAFENKDYETANEAFDIVIKNTQYPRDKFNAIDYQLRIGIAQKASNMEERFTNFFKEYGVNKNTFEVQLTYAQFLIFEKKQPEKAIQILEESLTKTNSRFQRSLVKIKLGEAYVFQKKYNKALIYFAQVQTKLKNHKLGQHARFKVAQTSYFKGDFKWAKAQLKVLKGSATQLIANDAVDLFLTISDNFPKDSIKTGLTELATADLLAYQQKNQEAIVVLDDVIKNYQGQPIEDEALFKQAQLYVKQQSYDEAILNYAKIIALDKEGIYVDDVYFYMAELYRNELNNEEKAKEYYQKIIFDHPNSIYLVDARKHYRKLRGDQIQ